MENIHKTTKMEEGGEVKIIDDGTGVYQAYAVWVASKEMVVKNPKAVDAVVRAF